MRLGPGGEGDCGIRSEDGYDEGKVGGVWSLGDGRVGRVLGVAWGSEQIPSDTGVCLMFFCAQL
jgi:hypothetical protein